MGKPVPEGGGASDQVAAVANGSDPVADVAAPAEAEQDNANEGVAGQGQTEAAAQA